MNSPANKNQSRLRSNSKNTKKVFLPWNKYIILIEELVQKIKDSKEEFDCIYGVPRGGMIPAVIISHALNIPIMGNPLDGYKKRMLIVDDLVDTGKTVVDLTKFLKEHTAVSHFKIASIYRHEKCEVAPDYYVETNNMWIEFPYEGD